MQKLYSLLAIFAIATLLSTSGLGAYLVLSGKLDAERAERIAAVLRGEHDEPTDAEQEGEAAGDAPADTEGADPAPESEAQIVRGRRDAQVHRALTERATRDLQAQQELLQHSMRELVRRTEQLDGEREAFAAQRDRFKGEAKDLGFREVVKLVAEMRAEQAKNYIVTLWADDPAQTVALFKALSLRDRKQIAEKLKTPDEERVLFELLEQLRDPRLNSLLQRSGTTPGN